MLISRFSFWPWWPNRFFFFESRRGRTCKTYQWFPCVSKYGTEKIATKQRSPANGFSSELREIRQNSSLAPRRELVRAFAVRRMNEDERWNGELSKKMQGTRQQSDPAKGGFAVPTRVSFDLLLQWRVDIKQKNAREVRATQWSEKDAGSREQDLVTQETTPRCAGRGSPKQWKEMRKAEKRSNEKLKTSSSPSGGQELGENEVEAKEVQRRSERDQGDEMGKVDETEMVQTFHMLSC